MPSLKMARNSLALAVIVALLVVAAFTVAEARRQSAYLGGFWVGEDDFMAEAELAELRMFVGPAGGGARRGHLLMANAAGVVSDGSFTLRVRAAPLGELRSAFGYAAKRQATLEFDESSPMPSELRLAVSVADGTLTLFNSERVFALFTKDLSTTLWHSAVEDQSQSDSD